MLIRSACLILCSFVVVHSVPIFGLSWDPRLLQLVPPESHVVAGILPSSTAGQLSGFLLVTPYNGVDLKDFFALTGGDPTRSVHEFVFVAAPGSDGTLSEHSLLVSGHFDREATFRLANEKGAARKDYRGVAVLAVEPFAREVESFNELRWLAIPDEGLAIFGSIASVQQELDRWIANSPTSPELLERLSRLDPRDETWCLLPEPRPSGPIASILGRLDARLQTVADEGRSIQYGIHIVGKDIEVTASNNPRTQAGWNAKGDPPNIEFAPLFNFLSGSAKAVVGTRVCIKIRQREYKSWLAGISGNSLLINHLPVR